MNQVALALAWAGMVLAAIELTLRILGLHRFPLFRSGGASVYHMRERQRGAFRHRSTWIYNECGMRTDRPFVASPGAVIVLGDSVVDGGLRISQDEMLARGIEAAAPVEVFPLACHGWAMRNQIEALAALPGWRNCGALVWVLNPGDFDTIGQGGSAFSFPEHRPWLLSLWLLRRYLLRRRGSARQSDPSAWPTPDPALRSGNLERAQDVLRGFEGIIVIVHFPARDRRGDDDPYWQLLARIHPAVQMVEVANLPDWNSDCYLDGLHPSLRGLELLAKCIVAALPISPELADRHA